MQGLSILLLFLSSQLPLNAQPQITRTGFISFFSKTPFEDIKAENKQVNAVVDLSKKKIAFMLLMRGFLFKKGLMQEHFNENYVESDKYPKSSFSGSYTGYVDISQEGKYPIIVKGVLTLHGISRTIEVPASMEVKEDKLISKSNFKINPSDYNIKIPAVVKDKIAQHLDVTVMIEYKISK
jgi:hypothetical protein